MKKIKFITKIGSGVVRTLYVKKNHTFVSYNGVVTHNCDEIDRASGETLLCLNSIMEGSPFYNKHTGEIIHPEKGFNIVATANTKGFGAQGKFLSQILDEAFLERFVITIEQEYPSIKIEKQILSRVIDDEDFIDTLCKWSQVIRESFYQNAIDSLISTRRLLHIAKTYKVFKNKLKAIEFCLNRFEQEEKIAFLDLYKKIANPEQSDNDVTETKMRGADSVAIILN